MNQIKKIIYLIVFLIAYLFLNNPLQALSLQAGDIVVGGSVDVGNGDQNGLVRINPITGAQEIISAGGILSFINGIAFESNTSVIVGSNSQVIRIDTTDGSQSVIFDGTSQGLSLASGVVIDDNNDIYASFLNGSALFRIDATTGTSTLIADNSSAGINQPNGITVDNNGNILIANRGNNTVLSIDPNGPLGSNSSILSSNGRFGGVSGVAVAPNGDIFFSDLGTQGVGNPFQGSAQVLKFNPNTSGQDIVTTGGNFVDATGIAIDSDGNLLVANAMSNGSGGQVIKIDPNNPVQNILSSSNDPGAILIRFNNSISGEIAIFSSAIPEPNSILMLVLALSFFSIYLKQ